MVTGEEDIIQSLCILFGTIPGERVLELEYGCDLAAHVFRPVTLAEAAMLEEEIGRAVIHYESRIKVESLSLDVREAVDGILHVQLEFIIDATNNRRNMVFPFYGAEGTLIPKR